MFLFSVEKGAPSVSYSDIFKHEVRSNLKCTPPPPLRRKSYVPAWAQTSCYRPLHGFRRHLGCGAVAAKVTANVWDDVQLSTPITPQLYIGF